MAVEVADVETGVFGVVAVLGILKMISKGCGAMNNFISALYANLLQPLSEALGKPLHIFRETPVIETTVTAAAFPKGSKPSRLSVGVQAGYGVVCSNGKLGAGPYLGIGLSYRF